MWRGWGGFVRKGAERMYIEGYREGGSTTVGVTLLEKLRGGGVLFNERSALRSMELGDDLQERIRSDKTYTCTPSSTVSVSFTDPLA